MSKDQNPSTPYRILLVEDDLDQAHLVKFLLEEDGRYAVTLAQDGLRGSLLVREHPWDLVITDLNLPGADGMAVVEASREHRPETPILATTGYADPEYGDRALRLGADAVLLKPLERDELRERVADLVEAGTTGRRPPEEEPPEPFCVLAFSVRPGDAEAGIGGALLRHVELGHRVILVTLTQGSPGDERTKQAKAAGRSMGVHFYVGKAGTGDRSFDEELRRLVDGALDQVHPDLVYVPTAKHALESHRIVHETARTWGADCALFAYDPGDAAPDFAPDRFTHVGKTLVRKLEVLETYDPTDGAHLAPELARLSARFWGRYTDGAPTEPLETLRGNLPQELEHVSLLPAGEVPLE